MNFSLRVLVVSAVSTSISEGLIQKIEGLIEEVPVGRSGKASEDESLPGLLVLASDHGEGTTVLSHAIGAHPCFIDIGEPFDVHARWYSPTGEAALLDKDGHAGEVKAHRKLDGQLFAFSKLRGLKYFHLDPVLHLKNNTLSGFFKAVQQAACAHWSVPESCRGRCVLVHKLFPVYVSYDLDQVHDYLMDPEVMVLQVKRDEKEIIQANIERFGEMGAGPIAQLEAWNKYLDNMRKIAQSQKIWKSIEMDKHIFASPQNFYSEIEKLYPQLGFDRFDHDGLLAPVRTRIDELFAQYEAKQGTSSHVSSSGDQGGKQ